MKSIPIPGRLTRGILALGVLIFLSLLIPLTSVASDTDLAQVPLANAPSAVILPNIALVIDDSGSMDEENMPDSGGTNDTKYCYKWYKYNRLAYDPGYTYKAPIKADGGRFVDSTFTAALNDGYFALSEKMYNKNVNGKTNLETLTPNTSVTTSQIVLQSLSGSRHYASSVKVTLLNGTTIELLNAAAVPSTTGIDVTDDLGEDIRDSINDKNDGFSASYDGGTNTLTITAPASQSGLATTPTITLVKKTGTLKPATPYPFFSRYNSYFYATPKTDQNSTTCLSDGSYNVVTSSGNIAAPGHANGSAGALTNYANWYSFYRKRAFLMKAGVGESFGELEEGKYRVGYFSINSIESGAGYANHDLAIADFSGKDAGTHRANWFDRLYGTRKDSGTPLLGALARMGKMYAGKISGWDPVQFSCQRNYTILSSDGYWNDSGSVAGYGPYVKDNTTTTVGDQDGVTGVTQPSFDYLKYPDTLADVAYYYYHTDLRPGPCASLDVCTNNVPPAGANPSSAVDDVAQHQHMTTFTVGLGVNGTLAYQDGYKTSTSGAYYNILTGTPSIYNWPKPSSSSTKIDDLWHAAVNGRGTYFSASDSASLAKGISTALSNITSTLGSGAAAATSNLQPVSGDNSIYIATYRTVKWDGEISAYTIDLSTGVISTSPTWQAATLLQAKIGSSGDSDTRTIYVNESGALKSFSYDNLSDTEKTYFDNSKLTQYGEWVTDQKTAGTGANLVAYLRGQDRNEDQTRDGSYGTYQRLYRDREKIIGDVVHSQPIYIKAPPYGFADAGYATFKTDNASRLPSLYVAANDGMLHAFDSTNGNERWAYVPAMVLPDLWHLADKNYAINHRFFLDGPLITADAKIGSAWKTVLIGGMGAGGKGYYALDVTNPTAPEFLWNFTHEDLGNSYGVPFVTKLANGSWVAVVTSGYNNNTGTGDGMGHVFVLNIADGTVLKDISTGVGTTDLPSGLARLNVQVPNFDTDNTATGAYGGDLYGNMWRFNLDAGTATKLAAFGSDKPIMAAPEIADVDGKKIVYFGTGQYLGDDDLTTKSVQSIYAIKDDGTSTITDTTDLVEQTTSTSGSIRTISKNAVDFSTKSGWFINLPDTGGTGGGSERVAVDLQLYYGTLVVASVVPTASECQPGGYSWMYQLDYRTGGYVGTSTDHTGGTKFTSPIVGFTVAKLPTGTPVIYPVTADGVKPPPVTLKMGSSGSTTGTKRVRWRELIN